MGYKADEIYKIFKKECSNIKYIEIRNIIKAFLGIVFRGELVIDGLNSGKKLEKIIEKYAREKNIKNISDIKKHLLIPSINVNDGKIYFFSSKRDNRSYSNKIEYVNDIKIWEAVRASSSYPGVFSPFKFNGMQLIDGGIRENVPWKELNNVGADKIITIIFSKKIKNKCKKNIIDVISNSIDILCHELSIYELEGAENLININTTDISLLDYSKIDYLYEIGYRETKKRIQYNFK